MRARGGSQEKIRNKKKELTDNSQLLYMFATGNICKSTMTKEEQISYWKELSDYDMETAEAMLTTHRWLYVGFMCHKVLEKTIKAYWCSKEFGTPPYIHNLARLAEGCELMQMMSEEQLYFIDMMTPMNIEARYPSYKESISRGLSESFCREMIDKTKEMQQWINQML